MIGSAIVETWLYGILLSVPAIQTSAVGNQVHRWPVPAEYTFPYITWFKEGAENVEPIGRGVKTLAQSFRYQIKVVDEGSDDSIILPVAEAMVTVLDDAEESLDGGIYITCSQLSELLMNAPPEGDKVYSQLGGIYSFFVGQTGE